MRQQNRVATPIAERAAHRRPDHTVAGPVGLHVGRRIAELQPSARTLPNPGASEREHVGPDGRHVAPSVDRRRIESDEPELTEEPSKRDHHRHYERTPAEAPPRSSFTSSRCQWLVPHARIRKPLRASRQNDIRVWTARTGDVPTLTEHRRRYTVTDGPHRIAANSPRPTARRPRQFT